MRETENKGRNKQKQKYFTIKQMAMIGVMTAVLCALGPFALPLPFSPVPLTLTNLSIFITLYVLGARAGTISYLLYLLLGITGLPVFSGFSGGLGKVAGPTGGYLLGFLFLSLIAGWAISCFPGRTMVHGLGMLAGMAVCYLFGTAWLALQLGIGYGAAFGIGVLPYLPGDAVKMVCALFIGPKLRREIHRLL